MLVSLEVLGFINWQSVNKFVRNPKTSLAILKKTKLSIIFLSTVKGHFNALFIIRKLFQRHL